MELFDKQLIMELFDKQIILKMSKSPPDDKTKNSNP
jgi:hypothetical protein